MFILKTIFFLASILILSTESIRLLSQIDCHLEATQRGIRTFHKDLIPPKEKSPQNRKDTKLSACSHSSRQSLKVVDDKIHIHFQTGLLNQYQVTLLDNF